MANTKIKDKLYEKLKSIEDEVLLQSVLNFIELESDETVQIHFNEEQIRLLNDAKLSARSNGIPNQEVFNKTKEWLKR